jgi:hypothetical protein
MLPSDSAVRAGGRRAGSALRRHAVGSSPPPRSPATSAVSCRASEATTRWRGPRAVRTGSHRGQ